VCHQDALTWGKLKYNKYEVMSSVQPVLTVDHVLKEEGCKGFSTRSGFNGSIFVGSPRKGSLRPLEKKSVRTCLSIRGEKEQRESGHNWNRPEGTLRFEKAVIFMGYAPKQEKAQRRRKQSNMDEYKGVVRS